MISLYSLIFISATVRQFFDPAWEAVLPGDRDRGGAHPGELVPRRQLVRIDGGRLRRGGLPGLVGDILLPFYIDAVDVLRRLRAAAPGRASGRALVRGGDLDRRRRRQPEERRAVPVANADPALDLPRSARPSSCRSGCGTSCSCRWPSASSAGREFEYGLQEGLTSVGFVVGSFFMAKLGDRLAEGTWLVVGDDPHGRVRRRSTASRRRWPSRSSWSASRASSTPRSRSRRRLLLQRHIPRDMRGRVFSAMFVSRDVLFLIGMAGAGLADIFPVRDARRRLRRSSSSCAGIATQFAPGLGQPAAEWRKSLQLLRTAPEAPGLGAGRPANMLDLDRLIDVLPELERAGDGAPQRVPRGRDGRQGPARLRDRARRRGEQRRLLRPRRQGRRRHPRRLGRDPLAVHDGRGRLLRRDRGAHRQPADGQRRERGLHRGPGDPGRRPSASCAAFRRWSGSSHRSWRIA